MLDDDTAGRIILPDDLPRILGEKFISTTQLQKRMGVHREHAQSLISVLVENGMFVPWLAAQCPHCKFVWPHHEVEDQTNTDTDVFCPVCNMTTPIEFVDFYRVYQIIRWLE